LLTWWPALAIIISIQTLITLLLFILKKTKTTKLLLFSSLSLPLIIAYPFLWVWISDPADKSGMMLHLIADVLMFPLMIMSWISLKLSKVTSLQGS
jgi:hypothetical protein